MIIGGAGFRCGGKIIAEVIKIDQITTAEYPISLPGYPSGAVSDTIHFRFLSEPRTNRTAE